MAYRIANVGKTGILSIKHSGEQVSRYRPDLGDAEIDISSAEKTTTTGKFTTINGGKLESCVVDLELIQDLHGYDKPWVGGSGKNKLQNTQTGTTEQHGLKITSNDDGSVFFHGGYTANALSAYDLSTTQDIPNGSYILNGCPSGGGSSTFQFSINDKNDTGLTNSFTDTGSGANVTISNGGVYRPRLVIRQGYTIPSDGLLFKPMLRLSTVSDATFEPYSNVCPIEGHTVVEVGNVGKNLLDESSAVQGTLNQTTGAEETSSTVKRSDFMMINASNVFQTSSGGIRFFWYDSNKSYISNEAILSGNSLSVPNTARYFRVIAANAIWDNPIMINSGTTATTYEPYQGQDIIVNLGGTYYKGILDVVSGVFTGIFKGTEFNGASSESWALITETNFHQYYIPSIAEAKDSVNAVSNGFPKISLTERGTKTGFVSYDADNAFRFALKDDELLISDVNAWKTWLSSNPLQVVFELATPIVIQLTPQQINTLVGENNIDTPLDGQSLTSAIYRDMFSWSDVEKEIDDNLRVIETSFTKNPSNTWLTVSNDSVIRSGNHVSVQINFSIADMPTVSGSVTLGTVPYAMKGGYKFGRINDGSSPFASRSEGVFVSSTNKNLNLCAQLPNGSYFLAIDYITADPI